MHLLKQNLKYQYRSKARIKNFSGCQKVNLRIKSHNQLMLIILL